MQSLFAPAIGLMNRLRYNGKFMVLTVAIGIVMSILLFTVYSNLARDIHTGQNEYAGLQMLKPMNKMVQMMQQNANGFH